MVTGASYTMDGGWSAPLTSQPRTHPAQRLGDVGRRPGERQPHVGPAVHGVEVDAGRDRNAGVGQQPGAEVQ